MGDANRGPTGPLSGEEAVKMFDPYRTWRRIVFAVTSIGAALAGLTVFVLLIDGLRLWLATAATRGR